MMALSKTPLHPDPGYEHTSNFYSHVIPNDAHPKGRVRPEAEDIARLHTAGSVSLLFQPAPPQPQSRYQRADPKRHMKENHRRIHEIQVKHHQKEEEEKKIRERPLHPILKNKYEHVPPKVTVHMQPSPACGRPGGPDRGGGGRVPVNGTDIEDGKKKDFLAANAHTASQFRIRRPPSQEKTAAVKAKKERAVADHKRGVVPPYLRRRQEEWRHAEEERLASLPDPSIPAGHALMPRQERLKTLSVLKENQEILLKELGSMSLRSDTLRAQKRKTDIEAKLGEIDDAIKIFSRPKVFIKLDE